MTYSGFRYSGTRYSGRRVAPSPGVDPIVPKPILSPGKVTGPRAFGTASPAIIPAPILSPGRVVGPKAPLDTATARAITPAPILTRAFVPGPWMPEPADDPREPVMPVGPALMSRAIRVVGYPNTTAVQVRPQINGVGSASFTIKGSAPALREVIGIDVARRRQLTGRVAAVVRPVVQEGEEAAQLPQVTVEGLLAEFAEAVVLPDFGAQDVSRLGPPTQDSRQFDWTMNGLGVDSPDGVPRPNIIESVAAAGRYGEPDERFPLPDVWPDPYAKWMWVADPARSHQPIGWCYFREPFGIPGTNGRIQVWCCAYDYAEVWLDGVPILTCDQAGVAQRVELEVRDDFHLLTIRAHNGGGRAGVLCTVLPVLNESAPPPGSDYRPDGYWYNAQGYVIGRADEEDGEFVPTLAYGEALRRSGGGWKALAYPTRTFRLNPAQVMNRLRLEARRRGVANMDEWQFEFNATYDSAGRPWPPNDPIVVQVGSTYLDVLAQLSTALVDYVQAPRGRVLRMYVKDLGTGRTRANPWTTGEDLAALTTSRSLR